MATVSSDVSGDSRRKVRSRAPAEGSDPLHRISEVRKQQGVSLRNAARQMNSDVASIRHQERADSDLRLSELLRWQRILDVPLIDLLIDPGPTLSSPIKERAQMVRLMKTAAAIREHTDSTNAQRLAAMLIEQLVEMMPELAEVGAWHSVGQRRSLDDYGRVFERRIRDDLLVTYRAD